MIKIILCCLNEEKTLPNFLQNLTNEISKISSEFEILICLDGSNDNSLEIINNFQNHKIKTLPIINQRGLGLAFKRLFLEIINNSKNDDLVISLDADNTHNPAQINEMFNYFNENNLDFLIASRFCQNSVIKNFPIHRQLISKLTSILLQILFPIKKINGKKLKDYSSGFRIYKAEILKKLYNKEGKKFITEPEFTYTCELLIKLSCLKIKLDEIALSYNYGKKIGKSNLKIMRNFMRLLIMIKNLKFLF